MLVLSVRFRNRKDLWSTSVQPVKVVVHACVVTAFRRHLLLVTLGNRTTKQDRPLI